MSRATEVAVVGAGSWGTALALHVARRHGATLWTRRSEHAAQMRDARRNERYLPEHELPLGLSIESDLGEALRGVGLVIWVVPSHGLRAVVSRARDAFEGQGPALHLVATKGIEVDTLATMADVLREELPRPQRSGVAALGGPSFAREVAEGKPCAVVVAAEDLTVAREIQRMVSYDNLRAYDSDDVVGVELGGALKNVIAIAAGMSDGRELGLNARAGLVTRGLAEMTRLAVAMGARAETLGGLAGVGDLLLTCTGALSRNRTVGLRLGRGEGLESIVGDTGMVAEGVRNTRSAFLLAARERVDMPITAAMHAVLYEGVAPDDALDSLMRRALTSEHR